MKKIFSLNIISSRESNLKIILPNILDQCDLLYVNLIGFNKIPDILLNNNLIISKITKGGSELRFFYYNCCEDDTYYFTIDDDILYPKNYAERLIENMKKYENKVVCCVHGCNINLQQSVDYYKRGRTVYHFKKELKEDTKVMIPGVGTSCFYKGLVKINLEDFKISNMSDPYLGYFLLKQKISIISIKRESMWLKPLLTNDKTIWGNNPYKEIDNLINNTFKKLI
jgi:hypothetical protein